MEALNAFMHLAREFTAVVAMVTVSNTPNLESPDGQVDDFSAPKKNSFGIERFFVDDSSMGGATKTEYVVKSGVMSGSGEIVPPRGQPGWASVALPLGPEGHTYDASAYKGLRLVIRIDHGIVSVSANSSKVDNFDYHAAPVVCPSDGEFHEVKIPFSKLKRAWSAQTRLDPKTLTGISLVAVGMSKTSFEYEIDEIGFY